MQKPKVFTIFRFWKELIEEKLEMARELEAEASKLRLQAGELKRVCKIAGITTDP